MESLGLRKKMMMNTISNYLALIVKTVLTIFLTRLIFLGVPRQEYGLWIILWSVFGYSLLLDFGFGVSVQKYTSEASVTKDWGHFNKLVSTIFFNYCIVAAVLAGVTLVLAGLLPKIFKFEEGADIAQFKMVFIMFGIGTAVVFPSGFFAEILRGLQLITLRNIITLTFLITNFIGMAFVIKTGIGLPGMAFMAISTNLLTNLLMWFYCKKKIPELKISLRNYRFGLNKNVMSFSVFAYLITFSNLVIFRTDQMVISICGAVSLVAVYQISSKLADLFKQFATQFHENLGPIASTLFTSGKQDKLSLILLQSNRLVGVIATLMFVPLMVFVKPLLMIWLELSDKDGLLCANILLASMYFLVFFRSGAVQVLLMCNQQKTLTKVAVIECTLNLVLSVTLIRYFGIIGVALGTLIPNIILGCVYSIPSACRFSKVSLREYFGESIIKTLIAGTLTAAVAVGLREMFYPETFMVLALHVGVTCAVFLGVFLLIGLHGWERKQAMSMLAGAVGKFRKKNRCEAGKPRKWKSSF